jgi:cobalt-zinc-cadmium efflux system outer membrane protein
MLTVASASAQTVLRPPLPGAPAEQAEYLLPSASGAAQTITLAEAVEMARRNSPKLRGAAAGVRRSTAAIQTASAYTNPSIEIYEGRQYARAIPTPGVPGLLQHYAAYQTIESPKERRARKAVAESAAASSRYGSQMVALSVLAEVKNAFYNVLRRREEVSHTGENLQLVQDLRQRVAVEVNVGEKGRLELTRAEAEVARARFAVRGAQLEFANAITVLRTAMAAPVDVNLNPEGSLEARVTLPPLPELREKVYASHPALAQTRSDISTAEASVKEERALRIPKPIAFTEFENQPDLRYWRAGVTVPLPLWDRRRGQIEESKAAVQQATATQDQRRLELTSALERAYEQYQLADQQATSLESGELRAAESAVQGAQAAYRFGERGIVEVLDAQRVLQAVRGDLVDAQYARQAALVDLEELGAVAPGEMP